MKNKDKIEEKLNIVVPSLCIIICLILSICLCIFASKSDIPDEPIYCAYGYGYVDGDKAIYGIANENNRFLNTSRFPDSRFPNKVVMNPATNNDTWVDKSYYQEVIIVTQEEKIKSKSKVKYRFNDDNFETNSYDSAIIHSFKSDDNCEIINYEDVKIIPEKSHTEKILIKCGYWSSDKNGPSKCEEKFVPPYIVKMG